MKIPRRDVVSGLVAGTATALAAPAISGNIRGPLLCLCLDKSDSMKADESSLQLAGNINALLDPEIIYGLQHQNMGLDCLYWAGKSYAPFAPVEVNGEDDVRNFCAQMVNYDEIASAEVDRSHTQHLLVLKHAQKRSQQFNRRIITDVSSDESVKRSTDCKRVRDELQYMGHRVNVLGISSQHTLDSMEDTLMTTPGVSKFAQSWSVFGEMMGEKIFAEVIG